VAELPCPCPSITICPPGKPDLAIFAEGDECFPCCQYCSITDPKERLSDVRAHCSLPILQQVFGGK
jgi:hypothetical protein